MAVIHYARTDEFWRRGQKYDFLDASRDVTGVDWRVIQPNANHTWLTEGMEADFDTFLPIGTQEAKAGTADAIFENYGRGVATSRDTWAYNFDSAAVAENMRRTIETYNWHADRWGRLAQKPKIGDFVSNDDRQISWSRDLKLDVQRGNLAEFAPSKMRVATYRPFTKQQMFFDRVMNEEVYQFPGFFPVVETEAENRAICVTDKGSEKPFMALMTDRIADLHIVGAGSSAQCFPFYTYAEDGSQRRENISDWALAQFRSHYSDESIDKWAIFHYVYALLHHPAYREKYAANLRRALPRIPFAPDFWPFAQAGARLAELHVNYESQPEYPLQWVENPDAAMSFRVEKMKLARDKTSLQYNDFLTLTGTPPAVFDYKLGNRAALEWVIDRYRVTTDKRSGIVNDPNAYSENPQYIVQLIGKVVTVSVETVALVAGLPGLE
jgi:predicted helicase